MKLKQFISAFVCLLLAFQPARAKIWTVTSAGDSGSGTLRGAIDSLSAGDAVQFTNTLSGQTILLTSGEIQLDQNVTIDASGLPGGIQINGNHKGRIFEVFAGVTAVLNSLTLVNGYTNDGAAVFSLGTLTLNRCTVAGNNNTSGGEGAGIYNFGGTLTLNQSTVANNSAALGSGLGGGIFNYSAGLPVTLNQCTVTGNTAGTGGGLESVNTSGAVNVTLFNTIVAGNSASSSADLGGTTPTLLGTNFIGGTPQLASLGSYGGPTTTLPPLPGSPVLNAGSDAATGSPYNFTTDQRGQPRLSGTHVDIGAVEIQAPVVTTTADSGTGSLRSAASQPVDLALGAAITFATNLSGQTIVFSSGEILLTNSTLIDASGLPGGISLSGNSANRVFELTATANLTLNRLNVVNATTVDAGGAIYTAGGSYLNVLNSTFSGCSGLEGGVILNDGLLQMANCTLTGNSAGYGGALQTRYFATLTHCTISGNYSSYGGGGIFNKYYTLTNNNCIIAGNTSASSGADIYSQLAALVYVNSNLVQYVYEDQAAANDVGSAPLAAAPQLAALGNYGGPTPTMPPLPASPAIDLGGATSLTNDQRGYPRVVGPAPDLGACEVYTNNPVVSSLADNGAGSLRFDLLHGWPGASSNCTFASTLSGQAIQLTSGQIMLNRNFTLDASALPSGVQINGNHASRFFSIPAGVTVVLNSLTLTNGFVLGVTNMNGYGGDALGGAISNAGVLTLNHCVVSRCSAVGGNGGTPVDDSNDGGNGEGGGIYNAGILSVSGSVLSGNTAVGGIGGTNVSGTSSPGGMGLGGGICNLGSVSAVQSILSANLAAGGQGGGGSIDFGIGGEGGVGYGGGIYTSGPNNLVLTSVTLTNDTALGGAGGSDSIPSFGSGGGESGDGGYGYGGGIYATIAPSSMTVSLVQSTIIGCSAIGGGGGPTPVKGSGGFGGAGDGGGIAFVSTSGALLSMSNSTVANSSALGGGGAVSTASSSSNGGGGGNAWGGGIYLNGPPLLLNQCTLAGNTAAGGAGGAGGSSSYGGGGGNGWGGGFFLSLPSTGAATVNQSTLSANSASAGSGGTGGNPGVTGDGDGGGIFNASGTLISLFNTIIAGNASPANANYYMGTFTMTGGNLTNGTPVLAPLGNYGGPEPTMPPLDGSPAIDAGSDLATMYIYNFTTDQRGLPRLSGPHVDIGAAEAQVSSQPPLLAGAPRLAGAPMVLYFTNFIGASFTVFATTNLALPFITWSNLGLAVESPAGSGQFQFTDPQATNNPRRFYRVHSP